MSWIVTLFQFLVSGLRRAVDVFSGIPTRLAVIVAGIGAVVAEIASFVDDIVVWFEDKAQGLDQVFREFSASVDGSNLFQMFSYCLALDELASIFAGVVGFFMTILTFLFVTLVHVVLIFFGLRFGYRCYKYLVTSFTNGIAKA